MHRLNLNLLVPFTVLIQEKHVSRAAKKLNISQSATSKLLAQLRETFNDSLLVRTANGMEVTERALQLYNQILPLTKEIDNLFFIKDEFNPHTLSKIVRIGMPNILADSFLFPIMGKLNKQAPHLQLDIQAVNAKNIQQMLYQHEIEMAITYRGQIPETCKSVLLLKDNPVCITRHNHPLMKQKTIKIEDYLKYEHIVLIHDELSENTLGDRLLKKRGYAKRNIKVKTRSPLSAMSMIAKSDMVFTITESFAKQFSKQFNLEYREFSIATEAIPIYLVWMPIYDQSHWHKWLRDLIKQM